MGITSYPRASAAPLLTRTTPAWIWKTTLKNFVAEATAGVVTMDSHNHQCGLGDTQAGELRDEQVWAELTVVPDTPLSALASYPNTDIFIKMIRRRKIRDVSIGASGGTWECNICGHDMWRSGRCSPLAGDCLSDRAGRWQLQGADLYRGIIKDAHLSEVSFVYSGAKPRREKSLKTQISLFIGRNPTRTTGILTRSNWTYLNKRFGAALDIRRANDYSTPTLNFIRRNS